MTWRRMGGLADCKCCRCQDCCTGQSPAAWYVDTTGASDGTCTFCDEAVAYVFVVDAVDGDADRCEWKDIRRHVVLGVLRRVRRDDHRRRTGGVLAPAVFVMRFFLTISCLDDDTYLIEGRRSRKSGRRTDSPTLSRAVDLCRQAASGGR